LHVITGSSSGSLKVWDFQTTKLVDKVRGVADLSVCLSHHGEWVSYNAENDLLSVLEVATVKPVAKFRAKGRIITSCFSRSNELVIIGGHDRTVQVYSMETQERVHSLKGHDGFITVLRCTENDRQLISASDDRTIRIWNLKTGECIHKCGEHKGWISTFAITEDQKKVVTGSIYVLDRAMKVFDIESGEEIHTLKGHNDNAKIMCTYNNTLVTAGDRNTVYVWDLKAGTIKSMVDIGPSRTKITCYCSVSPSLGVIGGYNGKLDLWNILKEKRMKKNKLSGAKDVTKVVITAIDVSHQGYLVACTNGTSNCKIWNLFEKQPDKTGSKPSSSKPRASGTQSRQD